MSRFVVIAFLLSCTPSLPSGTKWPSRADQTLAREALDAWTAAGLPEGQCASEIPAIRIWIGDGQAYRDVCGSCPYAACTDGRAPTECRDGCSAGCYRQVGPWRLVALNTPHSSDRGLLWHELHHWLLVCSGRQLDGDPRHADPLVWGTLARLRR